MPKIKPFRGVKAPSDKAPHLISRTYQDYSDAELEAELEFNPFSFLQILNPGYRFNHQIAGTGRFSLVRNRYSEFREEGILCKDEKPSIYLYENIDPHHSYIGFIAGVDTRDYEANKIKKHENTLHHKEILFKEYLKVVGFNAEPVLLTYQDRPEIDKMIYEIRDQTPCYHFSTTDHNLHRVWSIDDENLIEQITQQFENLTELYIADGHHRSASSALLASEEGETKDSYNYFMSYLISESQLNIYEFNRLVKDLNGLTKEEFLMQLDMNFRIQNRGHELYQPSKKHHFSMYLDGEFYSLYLRKNRAEISTPLDDLDAQMLYDLILQPILGIGDLRTDNRIDYSYGKGDINRLKERVDSREFAVAFNLFPATVKQMKDIANAGLTMPPKSTFIRPKLPSGLVIYEF
jgi:uncharacterized protein (DUF1015 family)